MLVKTLAILTSGGDSPGMNPAVRAVARTAIAKGVRVYGFMNGFQGILDDDLMEITQRSLAGMLDRGGTFLQSSRCRAFFHEEGRQQALRKLRDHRIDGLVVIGGDGSLRGALELSRYGVPVIGLPGTIDNDIYGTELGIGVDTTSNTIISMIDKIKDTARSHRRCFLIEVMGRNSGYLALSTAITTGAEVAVIPEYGYNMRRILDLMESRHRNRLNDSIIILAEGVCDAETFAQRMREEAGDERITQEIRKTVLGYVQRGGSPSHADRLLASQMGEFATLALLQGEHGSLVGSNKGRLTLIDLEKVCGGKKTLPREMLRLARNLGIEVGDPREQEG